MALRYGIAAALVGLALALQLGLEDALDSDPLLLFIPAVFLSSLLFDRGPGFFATALSAALAASLFARPQQSSGLAMTQLVPIGLFIAICGAISALTAALRTTMERLAEAEAAKAASLQDTAHRSKNDLTMVAAVLSLQAGRATPETRAALEAAVARIGVIAKAHDRRRGHGDSGRVEMADYLAALCEDIQNSVGDVRPIVVSVRSDPVELTGSAAISVGLIVNELVTNALRHAFPDGHGGTVAVCLRCHGEELELVVRDDGAGCVTSPTYGLGTRMIDLLVRNLRGGVVREASSPGCIVRVQLRPP